MYFQDYFLQDLEGLKMRNISSKNLKLLFSTIISQLSSWSFYLKKSVSALILNQEPVYKLMDVVRLYKLMMSSDNETEAEASDNLVPCPYRCKFFKGIRCVKKTQEQELVKTIN